MRTQVRREVLSRSVTFVGIRVSAAEGTLTGHLAFLEDEASTRLEFQPVRIAQSGSEVSRLGDFAKALVSEMNQRDVVGIVVIASSPKGTASAARLRGEGAAAAALCEVGQRVELVHSTSLKSQLGRGFLPQTGVPNAQIPEYSAAVLAARNWSASTA